jgi:hypothetical protein
VKNWQTRQVDGLARLAEFMPTPARIQVLLMNVVLRAGHTSLPASAAGGPAPNRTLLMNLWESSSASL